MKQYSWTAPLVPVISSVFSGEVDPDALEALPSLLAAQLVTPFDFRESLATARNAGIDFFLDCGPRSVLHRLVTSQTDPGDATVACLDHGPTRSEFANDILRALSWVLVGSVSGGSASAAVREPGVLESEVSSEAGSEGVEVSRGGASCGAEEICGALREAFAERTGYPLELIEEDLDLEADLGGGLSTGADGGVRFP